MPNEIGKKGGWKNYDEQDPTKDVMGVPIKKGSYVIYQGYVRGGGLHIGKVTEINGTWYKILTWNGDKMSYIDRHSYELLSYLPIMIEKEFNDNV